jgi:hypothetical protein
MFQLYTNLLLVNAKCTWNKIVHEQAATSDSYADLHCCSKKGPRGFLRKSFDDCMMFNLLTVFPNNATEQELYYMTNVLKKPQHVSICWFVQCVEQHNSKIAQLPCCYITPSAELSMIPMNVPFAKADIASKVL